MRTNRRHQWLCAPALLVLLALALPSVILAADPPAGAAKKEGAAVEAEAVVTNLESPCGIAIQPSTGHVFVASRYGVYRYIPAPGNDHKAPIEIAGYPDPIDVYGKGPKYNIGPLGLAFLNNDHLVVGDGSRVDGEELVRVYKVGDKGLVDYQKEDAAAFTLGPIKAGEQSAKGEGNFYGVAVGGNKIFVTCNGDDTKGWIAMAEVTDGKPGELKPYIATKPATEVDAPVPVTFTTDGKELVVGQMGEVNTPGDSLLTFYDPATGKLLRKLKTGLHDLSGLAYSPKTQKLYGTDFAWANPSDGGLFELVIEGEEVKPKKILSLDKPTGIAFDKDGRLYVSTFGTEEKDSGKSPGALSVIKEGL